MDKDKYILIDSSVWIDYFRGGKSTIEDQVNLLLDEDRAAICGMVELEILQGLRGAEQALIQDLFGALHYIEAQRIDFISAGNVLNELRRKGITIPSSDCLIATQCIRNDFALFTLDNDFKHIRNLKFFK